MMGGGFSAAQVLSVSLWARWFLLPLTNLLVLPFSCIDEACDFLARVLRDSCYHVVTRRTSTKLSDRREENCAFPPGERLEGVRHQSTSREMTCAAAVWNQKWPSGKTVSRQTCGRSVPGSSSASTYTMCRKTSVTRRACESDVSSEKRGVSPMSSTMTWMGSGCLATL